MGSMVEEDRQEELNELIERPTRELEEARKEMYKLLTGE